MPPILDRIYLKTETGRRAACQCTEKADAVIQHLNPDEKELFVFLSDLEKFFETFLRTAYTYQVQAP